MTENFSGMYWIRKRVEHEELANALRAAERRERRRAEVQRCAQCGREDTRGFRTLVVPPGEGPYVPLPPITVCSNENACRKRWPKVRTPDD